MSDALRRWADQPGPARLLGEARRRLEAGHTGDRVPLAVELDADERSQAGRLLGIGWQTGGDDVTLGRLRKAVTAAGGDLTDLLVAVGGPLRDLPGERRTRADVRTRAMEAAYGTLGDAGVPAAVVDLARRRRWLGRPGVDDMDGRAQALARLWAAMPAPSRPLAELANALFDDPHALDRDSEIGRLAARILAAAAGPGQEEAAADGALAAAAWRDTWAAYGVLCDQVSSTVLVVGLALTGAAAAAALTRAALAAGEPLWLTARSLRGEWAPAAGVRTVRVCENPSVVEAATDALGAGCPPLVCIYGRPSTAAWKLLRGLSEAGVRLLVTADRDADGTRFSDELLTLPGAAPWLPDAEGIYEEARLHALLADLRTEEPP